MAYYNTTQLYGEDLKKAIQKAASQEEAILLMFKNVRKPYSPSKVLELMKRAGHNWPIQSIRRALTNMTTKGDLIKTSQLTMGMYGAPEHQWELNFKKHPLITSHQQSFSYGT